LPPVEKGQFRLPHDYFVRQSATPFVDTPAGIAYQPHVYELAIRIAERSGAKRIIDIGCGNGEKLAKVGSATKIVGIDAAHARNLIGSSLPHAEFIEANLEEGLPGVRDELFEDAVVICSDVIEHLQRPDYLVRDLARIERKAVALLISTPDRTRARGLGDMGPPANPSHFLEWSADELVRFLSDCGMRKPPFHGFTINNNLAQSKITILIVAGEHMRFTEPANLPKVAALINTFNERDMIEEVLRHLAQQGVAAHVFDNWSTDGTYEALLDIKKQGLCAHVARHPEASTNQYLWKNQLDNVEAYANTLNADWVLHYDADELRFSPWHGVSLRSAIGRIDHLGYNAVDFTVLNFRFTAKCADAASPYQKSLMRFEFGNKPGHFVQIKGWKNTGSAVSLSKRGGHEVDFPDRRVFPLNFLNKHYPLRNQKQANIKIFQDRLPRYEQEQKERGWHRHYKDLAATGEVQPWSERNLIGWHEPHFTAEYLVERLSGIGIALE